MSDPLHPLKRKLDVPNAFLRRTAVAALFSKASSTKSVSAENQRQAILLCLTHFSPVVVEEAVSQLRLATDITKQNAMGLILAALPAAPDSSCGGCLMEGLVELWWLQILSGGTVPDPPSPFSEEHILVAAILLQHSVKPILIHSIFTIMLKASTSSKNQAGAVEQAWHNLRAFFEWGLMWRKESSLKDIGGSSDGLALTSELLAVIVKLSSSIMEWRAIFLPLMVRYIGLIPLATSTACTFTSTIVSDVVMVIEAELEEPSIETEHFHMIVTKFLALSFQFCHDASSRGMGSESIISAIRHIAFIISDDGYAEILSPFLPLLGLMCMRATGRSRHILLGTTCEVVKDMYLREGCAPHPAELPGMLLLPALQATTLRSSKLDRQWGPHLVSLISEMFDNPPREQPNTSIWDTSCSTVLSGELGLLVQATRVVRTLWWKVGSEGELSCWLKSLGESFQGTGRKKKDAEKQPFGADDNSADEDLSDHVSVFSLVLCSLLTHSDPGILCRVVGVLEDFLVLVPTEAPSFLPVVLFQLQRLGQCMARSPSPGLATAELTLLQSLRSMCGHPHVLPWILRTLQSLMEEGKPEVVRCASLRTLCSSWLKYGVGWKHVQGILGGLVQSRSSQDKMLQLTLAACLRDVCEKESGMGLDIIAGIQQCVLDPDACVSALGLSCISMMCAQDILDFYKAWKVVQRWHPKLPAAEIVACEWIKLIGHGDLDAHAYAEKVEAILSILWSTTKHQNPVLRKEAYKSLAAYSLDVLEPLELLSPLTDYVQLLLVEKDPQARLAAEGVVMIALDHEHTHRRRYITTKSVPRPQTGVGSEKGSLIQQLSVTLPSTICSGLEGSEQESFQKNGIPFMSGPLPGALLICYSPKASITGEALGPKYTEVFLALCDSLAWSSWTHPYMALSAWKVFITRWLGAISNVPDPIWEAIHQAWSHGLAPSAGNALLAAGALSMTGKMSEVHLKWLLQESKAQLQSGSSSTVICCAAHILSVCSSALHPVDWAGRLDIAAHLKTTMCNTESGMIMSGCAEALGMTSMGIVYDDFLLKRPECVAFLADTMSFLICCLVGLCPETEHMQVKLSSSWPDTWPALEPSEHDWKDQRFQDLGAALSGICSGISIVGCAVLKAGNSAFPVVLANEMVNFLQRISVADGLLVGALKGLIHLIPCLSRFQAGSKDLLDAALEASQHLAENSYMSQGVRGWAAFSIGVSCSALLDTDPSTKYVPKKVSTYVQYLVERIQAASGETEACCGGMMGLGSMIGGVALPCRELDEAGPSNLSLNLLTSPVKGLTAHASKVVGILAFGFTDPRASTLATWISVAAGRSCKMALSSAPSSAGAATALASYPADGAMRPLVEQFLSLQNSMSVGAGIAADTATSSTKAKQGATSSTAGNVAAGVVASTWMYQIGALASMVRCLRQAKRIPLLHWGGICQQILEICRTGKEGCEELEVEVVGLCLAHARTPSHYLQEVLEGLVMPHVFAQLFHETKKCILQRMASVVAALPAAHVPRILKQIPNMVLLPGTEQNCPENLDLMISAWKGLEAAIQWGPEIGKKSVEVSDSLIASAGDLVQNIPIPSVVYPGDFHSIQKAVGGSQDDRSSTQDSKYGVVNEWGAWAAATSCFKALKESEGLQLTKMEGSPSRHIRSMLMRSLLVWTGGLSIRELVSCRRFCMDNDLYNSQTILSLAYSDAPTTLQHQFLTEILENMKESNEPSVTFRLVQRLVAVWHLGSSPYRPGHMHVVLCLSSPENHNFPSVLADLLTTPSMTPYIQPIVGILSALLESSEESSNSKEWQEIKRTVCECLRAIRHKVDDDVLRLVSEQWECYR